MPSCLDNLVKNNHAPTMPLLDHNSPVPLYHQLAELLMTDIREGKYTAGTRIPSEPMLAKTYDLGRPTVRQATDLLVRQQRLERRRGSGTFVKDAPEQVDALSLAGTMASFQKTGKATKTKIIDPVKLIEVKGSAHPMPDSESWYLRRLSSANKTPILLESLWLSQEHFPRLNKIKLSGRSLSALAREHFHLHAISADQSFQVIKANNETAGLLNVKLNEAVLLVKRTVHFTRARNAVYSELICRTDQMVFSQTVMAATDTPI